MRLDARKLINARHRKMMSQAELADACGLTRQTVWNAEHGEVLSTGTAKSLVRFLELDPDDVVLPMEGGDAA
jgi:DNA-binding XRE family transcriptional regulator